MSEPIIMNVNGWLLTVPPCTSKSSTFHSRKAERVNRNTQILRDRYLAQYTLAATSAARHHKHAANSLSSGYLAAAEYWQLEARHWHQRAVRARLLWELCKTDGGAVFARDIDAADLVGRHAT